MDLKKKKGGDRWAPARMVLIFTYVFNVSERDCVKQLQKI